MRIGFLNLSINDFISNVDFISGIVFPVLTTLATMFISYLSRRKLIVSPSLDDEKIYNHFYENEMAYFKMLTEDINPKLTTPPDWPESFRILSVIISNESAKPIRIQNLLLLDRKGEPVKCVDQFEFNFANNRTFTNDEVTIVTSNPTPKDGFIWFQKINLFIHSNILIEPYESLILNYAVDSRVTFVKVVAHTTLIKNPILRFLGFLRNIFFSIINNSLQRFSQQPLFTFIPRENKYKVFSKGQLVSL